MITVQAPMFHIPGLQEKIDRLPTDSGYQDRAIQFDGERAGRMGDDIAKSCPWGKGTRQYHLWMLSYNTGKHRREMGIPAVPVLEVIEGGRQ